MKGNELKMKGNELKIGGSPEVVE